MQASAARVTGLNHVTLAVQQLARSISFYVQVLGLRPLARWSRGAYLSAGEDWVALIEDQRCLGAGPADYTHIAFTVDAGQFEELSRRIIDSGATIWQENQSEGPSLYFLDPDGHRLEIHVTDLAARLHHARLFPWDRIDFLGQDPPGV